MSVLLDWEGETNTDLNGLMQISQSPGRRTGEKQDGVSFVTGGRSQNKSLMVMAVPRKTNLKLALVGRGSLACVGESLVV